MFEASGYTGILNILVSITGYSTSDRLVKSYRMATTRVQIPQNVESNGSPQSLCRYPGLPKQHVDFGANLSPELTLLKHVSCSKHVDLLQANQHL